jgi:hypothetical protein
VRTTVSIKKLLFTTAFFLLQVFLLSAQSITIKLDKDTINFSETVVLRLSGEAKDIKSLAELSNSDGVIIIGTTRQYSYVGNSGKVKFTQTFTLSPFKVGTFTIGPAWVQAGGVRVFSNKVKLTVKSGSQSSVSKEIFMRCEPDKKKAYIGEQITLALRIYYRVNFWPGEDRPLAKTFNGFWYHEGSTSEVYKDSTVLINGLVYFVKTIYKEYVFPNTEGDLKIPSYEYACFVKQNPFPTGDPLVDDVMGIQMPMQLISPEVPIEVIPLPLANKPAGFSGDVGKFSLSASIDKENAKVNEAVTLTVTITGKGNISFVQLPHLKFPAEIESYPPVSSDSTRITGDGIEGDKTFTMTLIPKKEGVYTLPEIAFSYYDDKTKEYTTVKTPEFKLNVAPGDPAQNVSENNLPESFLDGSSTGKIIGRILWILIPAVLLFFLYYRSRKKDNKRMEEKSVVEETPETETLPVKNKPDVNAMIRVAERFFVNGNIQSGIAQLYETLLSAVLFKTELNREEASIHQVRYRLGIKNLSPELINETIQFMDDLSAKRYSAIPFDNSNLSESLLKTRKLSAELLS